MDRRDDDLQRELHEFRKQEMQARYGAAMANNLGPAAIMSDEVLARIVACAHANRIETIEHLKQEVKWIGIKRYGKNAMAMILKHRAGNDGSTIPRSAVGCNAHESVEDRALLVISPQVRGGAVRMQGKGVNRTSKKRTCGKCGAIGHICEFEKISMAMF
ncbi:hypothetical protein EWM64_g3362 [Hericium alpestre]|uniref:Uncharacterized protein n=1 Tax=Hericium alpestre TaxID=135208 RepID=A0A4Z0A1T5_9AGAM|nr:hypothetical protein EWM64_g3362 [Hericium alpestre]